MADQQPARDTRPALLDQVLDLAPALDLRQYAVVGLPWDADGEGWNTGRTYDSAIGAFARQTREISSQDCRAFVVLRHANGLTVYLGRDHVLGTREAEHAG